MSAGEKRLRRPLREDGGVSPLGAMMCIVLLFALAFAVDLGAAFATAQRQNSDLQIARETLQQTGNEFVLKNAADLEGSLSRKIADALQEQGYDGAVNVYVLAKSRATAVGDEETRKLGQDKCVAAYTVLLYSECDTYFARLFGIEKIPIETTLTGSAVYYSSGTSKAQGTWADGALYYVNPGEKRHYSKSDDLVVPSMGATERSETLAKMKEATAKAASERIASLK